MTQQTLPFAGEPCSSQAASQRPRILVVEDEQGIRELLVEILNGQNCETEVAATGLEALHQLKSNAYDLVLLDLNMPVVTGLELLRSGKGDWRDTGFIVLTGCGEISTAVEAMRLGALDYVRKPFTPDEIISAVHKARAQVAQRTEDSRRKLESLVSYQFEQLASAEAELARNSEAALEALVAALDARECETQNHSKRVSEYAAYLASAMGMPPAQIDVVRRAGMLHDIGKIGVSDRILLKKGPLSKSEWALMKAHPEIGQRILQTLPSLERESEIVLTHHERCDGTGYPHKLRGAQIPFGSRIFSVVDSFDAMTSDRPYRLAMPFEAAAEEILRCSGSQFDPDVVRVFERIPLETWAGMRARSIKRGVRPALADRQQERLLA
ncbi:MAG TPA: HD domain-containing phosphohydrolase [Bryobacteraceae bacterium]|nr:HD domain-containing phosphohydrolase [Bryobacteraceae bacterium]